MATLPNSPDDSANLIDLLDLPEPLQRVVRSLRQRPTFTLVEFAGLVDDGAAAEVLADLQARGLVESLPSELAPELPSELLSEEPRYRLRLTGRRRSPLKDRLWQKLEEPEHE